MEKPAGTPALITDRADEDDGTRQLVLDRGFVPVVPPKSNRLNPWECDREMYRRRNEVERLFRRLTGFPRIFSRFEKLDVIFLGVFVFVLVIDALR
jgi:transposase